MRERRARLRPIGRAATAPSDARLGIGSPERIASPCCGSSIYDYCPWSALFYLGSPRLQVDENTARARFDRVAVICITVIGICWFALDTLVFSVGRVEQPTRFYQLLAVIDHPA